jgi:hypothetical protein
MVLQNKPHPNPSNCVSFIIGAFMHLLIEFTSYSCFCFPRVFGPILGASIPQLWLKLCNFASRILKALKRRAHVPHNSSIVKMKVPRSWPLWEKHLPGM